MHLKATDMTIVNHDCEGLAQDLHIHLLVELGCYLRIIFDDDCDGMSRLETQIHELGLLVLHRKDHDHHHTMKILLLKAEKTLRAVLDYVHYQCKEAFSEVSVALEIVLNVH